MKRTTRLFVLVVGVSLCSLLSAGFGAGPRGPQGGKGPRGGQQSGFGRGGGAQQAQGRGGQGGRNSNTNSRSGQNGQSSDMQGIRYLFANRQQIQRQVTNLPNGVQTLTESANPQVVQAIQVHVRAMMQRMEGGRPIAGKHPLFAALFANANKIQKHVIYTPNGVAVVQISDNALTIGLVQTHAKTVSLFLTQGPSALRGIL